MEQSVRPLQAREARAATRSAGASSGVTPAAPFPRRILLAVTGLSPQVVTESLYALAVAAPAHWIPTEVSLLTTGEGAEHARLTLLSEDPGWFHRLGRDYALPSIAFDEGRIRVLAGPDGAPLPDIRTLEDNERAADQLTEHVRELTADPECALHVSIAGGRKTMGFYAGYALSLFGRPQDRLSHVLVSPPYESNQEFYYPTPNRRVIYTPPPESRPLDVREAEVTLAEIPFVRLRHGLDERLLRGTARYSEVVAAAQRAVGPPELLIDLDARCIVAGGATAPLAPAPLAFLSWLARRAKRGQPGVSCPADGAPEPEQAREYLLEYRHIADPASSGTARRLSKGMDKAFFQETRSRLQRQLRAALGPEGALRYGVAATPSRPRRYSIALPPGVVRWMGGV